MSTLMRFLVICPYNIYIYALLTLLKWQVNNFIEIHLPHTRQWMNLILISPWLKKNIKLTHPVYSTVSKILFGFIQNRIFYVPIFQIMSSLCVSCISCVLCAWWVTLWSHYYTRRVRLRNLCTRWKHTEKSQI